MCLKALSNIGVWLLTCCVSFAQQPVPADGSDISPVLQSYVERHELAGAVTLVASKDRVLSLEAVGYSDIASNKPMQTDSLFWIASMSKPIAATALMILVDEGRLGLDDPVQKYLPQFTPRLMKVTADGAHVRLEKPSHPITVRNLLNHTSGLIGISPLESPTLDLLPPAIRVQSYSLEPLMFEPGSEFTYSNAGINTAARIVEVVSGVPYEKFLQQRLFNPLGMKDTSFWPTEAQSRRLAKSYDVDVIGTGLREIPISQVHYPLDDRGHRFEFAAGGLFSTASDLVKFCQMILNGGSLAGKRYLSESAVLEMTRNQLSEAILKRDFPEQSDPESPAGYGLGWFTYASGRFGHPGAYATNMSIDPAHGLITIWLVQHAGFPGNGRKSQDTFERAVEKRFIPSANGATTK